VRLLVGGRHIQQERDSKKIENSDFGKRIHGDPPFIQKISTYHIERGRNNKADELANLESSLEKKDTTYWKNTCHNLNVQT